MNDNKFELENLVELQQIERIIYKKAAEISRLQKNEKFAKLKLEFSAAKEAYENNAGQLNALENEAKKIEDTLRLQEEKIKNINSKLFSGTITSSKELVNFQDEIKQLKNSNNSMEDREIKIMMELDEKRPLLKKLQENKATLEKEINDLTRDIIKNIKVVEKSILELKKKREEAIGLIPSEILNKYNELKKRKDGVAVSVMKDGFCLVCSVQIPPQSLEQIKDAAKIHKCPMCSRMLIINNDRIEEIKKLYESY